MTTATAPGAAALVTRAAEPDFAAWRRNIVRLGGCTNPIHLVGAATVYDTTTGAALVSYGSDVYGGRLLTSCGNRRATVCPACSGVYRADTYQLVRAGLVGGKSIPEAVSGHPRVFVTLTAPSFGPVHTRRERDGSCGSAGLAEQGSAARTGLRTDAGSGTRRMIRASVNRSARAATTTRGPCSGTRSPVGSGTGSGWSSGGRSPGGPGFRVRSSRRSPGCRTRKSPSTSGGAWSTSMS